MGLVTNNTARRWPGNVVPFTLDPGISGNATALGFVNAAIQHWNTNTAFRLIPRTTESDFVIFTPNPNACSSPVGKVGGPQQVSCALASGGFNAGSVIHEIGHAVGFWHEQGRSDRNANVTIVTAAIQPAQLHNFDQHIADGTDVGPYDFGSIMHYPRSAFPIVPGTTTIIAPVPIGITAVLSPGDIATANWLAATQQAQPGFDYRLTAMHSGHRLDVYGANNDEGGRVCQAFANASDAQIWNLSVHPQNADGRLLRTEEIITV